MADMSRLKQQPIESCSNSTDHHTLEYRVQVHDPTENGQQTIQLNYSTEGLLSPASTQNSITYQKIENIPPI
eukprot:180153-Pleurochrysis_carterae.AAC.1